jgi:hypothetical protein
MKFSLVLYKSKTLAEGSHPLKISMVKPQGFTGKIDIKG